MAKAKNTGKLSRKETQKLVFDKLSAALADFRKDLKEKKLVSSLKKVSKSLASDIVKAARKNGKVKKAAQKDMPAKKETVAATPSVA